MLFRARSSFAVPAALALIALAVLPGAALAGGRVAVDGSNTLVRPTETTTITTNAAASLTAAKNEFESFQIFVVGDASGWRSVDVSLAGALVGPNGATIAPDNVTIYREAYYKATGYTSDGELGGALGDFADALIPKVDPWYGETRSAFPIDVPANANRAAWVDVFVPAGAVAGAYKGSFVVTANGATIATVPLTLTVEDWAMPSTSSLGGGIDMNITRVCQAQRCDLVPGGEREIASLYARAGLDNRVSLLKPASLPSAATPADFVAQTLPLLTGAASPGVRSRLSGAKLAGMFIPSWDPGSADDLKKLGSQYGFVDRVAFFCDELGRTTSLWNSCLTQYNSANTLWKNTAPANGDLPLAITADMGGVNWARANGFTALTDRITTLIPLVNRMNPRALAFPGERHLAPAAGQLSYDSWLTSGKKLWMYQSCSSMGCTPSGNDVHPEWVGWPSMGIDQPASQARAMGWLAYEYDVSGDYYFDSTKTLNTAWTNQWTVDGGNHGDGTLFYPGLPAGGTNIPAIGGTKQIPIESIRLKRTRDGHEDYEYLVKLQAMGKGSEAKAIAKELFPIAFDTTRTQAQIDAARGKLIALLPVAPAPVVTPPPPPPAPTGPTCNGVVATIVGTDAKETLTGTAGDDVIVALGGDDTIRGLGGNDTVCAGDGNDTVDGGVGNDYLDGGAGGDTIDYASAPAGVTANLTTTVASGGNGTDAILAFEDLYGSAYADSLTGSSMNNFIVGNAGNDTIDGSAGKDYVTAGAGADTITVRNIPALATTVVCGTELDTVQADALDAPNVDCETVTRG